MEPDVRYPMPLPVLLLCAYRTHLIYLPRLRHMMPLITGTPREKFFHLLTACNEHTDESLPTIDHDTDDGRNNMPGRGPVQKVMDPKPFKGEFGEWDEYLSYWESIVHWNKWDDDVAAQAWLLALHGDAAVHIHMLPNFKSLTHQESLDVLDEQFGAEKTAAEDEHLLDTRRKKARESYEHLAQDIIRLANRVFPGAPELAKWKARTAFSKSLPDQYRNPIAAANPKTFMDCVNCIAQL